MTRQHSKESVGEMALALHKKKRGKLRTAVTTPLTKESIALIYTPGVGAVSSFLATMPNKTNEYTWRGRTVAVVSDGSAVLGLGNIGPEGALPVMEGKAVLFKQLADIDAVPIVLATQNTDEIVAAVKAIAPSFAGINLEDISAPRCFDVERRLKDELTIPVMHDDQHGTAIVVLAGLINAHKVVKKNMAVSRVAVIGAGAAGTAIARLLVRYGVGDVVVVDSVGIISYVRGNLTSEKIALAEITNRERRTGGVLEAVAGADVVVGVSGPGTIIPEYVRIMAQRPIVFALANPLPEIMPSEACMAGAAVVATGRSDFPNQVNNALVFPGVFKGALENNVRRITDDVKVRVAEKLASLIAHPTPKKILPTLFDRRVVRAVASAVR
ncbi:MAG: NADP-dependent malic enzyme [Candidatus Pacebacteria bacterium]|nr:NADP-dependent malic enzyme [Candidatus Paceibacterota bacterium]